MRISKSALKEACREMGANGSAEAVIEVVWDYLNLPDEGELIKVGGELQDKWESSSKGTVLKVTMNQTLENVGAVLAILEGNCEVAVISQKSKQMSLDLGEQTELETEGEGEPLEIEA